MWPIYIAFWQGTNLALGRIQHPRYISIHRFTGDALEQGKPNDEGLGL